MNGVALLALYAAIPLCLLAFAVMKPRHAVLFAFVGGWMFLPVAGIKMKGIPDLSKVTTVAFGTLLGACIFDWRTVLKFRPNWYDIPMFVYCFSPFLTSIRNDLGAYDGFANCFYQVAMFGLPYLIGRIYFNTWEAFRDLGVAIFIGGLIYIPFCWFEIRFSPQLHKWIYGKSAHDFAQEKRWGGFRPQVFMQSGLAIGMWMITCATVGVWLWITGSVKKVWNIPTAWLAPVLVLTAIFCKATGAIGLMFAGLTSLFFIKGTRLAIPILVIVAVPPVYMYQRTSQNWDGEWLKAQAYKYFGEERGQSFETRIDAENKVTDQAMNQADDPWFGQGKWTKDDPSMAPWRIYQVWEKYDPMRGVITVRKDTTPTDGLWLVTLGTYGIVALMGLTSVLLLPILILWMRAPLRYWSHPMVAAAAAMAVLVALSMTDNLLNGMINPIFMLAAGGIVALPSIRKWARAQGHQPVMAAGSMPAGYGAMPVQQPPPIVAGGFRRAGTMPPSNAAFPTDLLGTPMPPRRR